MSALFRYWLVSVIVTALCLHDSSLRGDVHQSVNALERMKKELARAIGDNGSASLQDDDTFIVNIKSDADNALDKIALLPVDTRNAVSVLWVQIAPQNKRGWEQLERFPRLRGVELEVEGTWPKEATESVKAIKRLEYLTIECDRITKDELRAIAKSCSALTSIELRRIDLRGLSLGDLAALKKLRHLGLAQSQVTSHQLSWLPRLEHLESLDITDTMIDDDIVPYLAKCGKLEKVMFVGTKMSEEGIDKVDRICRGKKDIR